MAIYFPGTSPQANELADLLTQAEWPLDRAALIVAKLEDPQLDIDLYVHKLNCLASEFDRRIPSKRNLDAVVTQFIHFMAFENGFTGDEKDYFNPGNSYLHRVMDNRRGIPIALSIIYMEVARRVRLPLLGIGMPGHFLLQVQGRIDNKESPYIDPFYRGELLTESGCKVRFRRIYGEHAHFDRRFLRPLDKRQILARLINNLKGIFSRKHDTYKSIKLIDLYLALYPDTTHELLERGLLYRQLECFSPALHDLENYFATLPEDDAHAEERQRLLTEIAALKRLTLQLH